MKRKAHGGRRKGAGRPPRAPFSGLSLRLRRTAAGLSSASLADLVGCAKPTLTAWERDAARPDAGARARLASALRCTVADLQRAPKIR